MLIRRRYQFYGRVQGVGFRYTARQAAVSLGITGWVRNEYDGSVVMEAQGTPAAIRQLLLELNDGWYIRIERMEEKELPVEEGEHRFVVLHG